MILKTWRLDYQQTVSVDHKRRIYFNHYNFLTARRSALIISMEDFLNLNDIILNWEQYGRVGNLPISDQVWLSRRWLVKRLYHSQTGTYIAFSKDSWLKYKNSVHYLVLHFLRDGRQLQDREHHANNKTAKLHQSRRSAQLPSTIQIPTRSSTDAVNSTKQRAKHSSLSKRHHTTPRCHFKFRCAVDEMRARRDSAADIESGEDINSELGDIEHCSID